MLSDEVHDGVPFQPMLGSLYSPIASRPTPSLGALTEDWTMKKQAMRAVQGLQAPNSRGARP